MRSSIPIRPRSRGASSRRCRRPRKSGRWSRSASPLPAGSLVHAGSGRSSSRPRAERGTEQWKEWRQSAEWQEWCQARAPVVAAQRRAAAAAARQAGGEGPVRRKSRRGLRIATAVTHASCDWPSRGWAMPARVRFSSLWVGMTAWRRRASDRRSRTAERHARNRRPPARRPRHPIAISAR